MSTMRPEILAFAEKLEKRFKEEGTFNSGDWKNSNVAWMAEQLEPRMKALRSTIIAAVQSDLENNGLKLSDIKREALNSAAIALMIHWLAEEIERKAAEEAKR